MLAMESWVQKNLFVFSFPSRIFHYSVFLLSVFLTLWLLFLNLVMLTSVHLIGPNNWPPEISRASHFIIPFLPNLPTPFSSFAFQLIRTTVQFVLFSFPRLLCFHHFGQMPISPYLVFHNVNHYGTFRIHRHWWRNGHQDFSEWILAPGKSGYRLVMGKL
jgi:hypothetical protein